MKPTPALLAASSLLTLLSPSTVHADIGPADIGPADIGPAADGILNFDLPEPTASTHDLGVTAIAPEIVPASDPLNQPLPIPARAANPPMRYHSPQQLPAGVYRRGVAVALNEGTSATALLPPAPPLPTTSGMVAAALPTVAPAATPQAAGSGAQVSEMLDFALEPSAAVALARAKLATSPLANPLPSLFEGNSDSLVAWAVGGAEGTRTPTGAINPAYFGHTDPGNRAWNMGTFSYQHGAATPEEADQKQLKRLQHQGEVLRQRALDQGLNLTLEETLNGLDLANQSPLAAIGRVGYIERLAEAKANGHEGAEAIVIARTRAYINPKTGRWNAPGLGNTEASIRRDQQRRANAVAQAIAAYDAQNPTLQPQTWTLAPPPEPLVALDDTPAEPVDDMLQMWTSPRDPIAQTPSADDALAAAPPPAALALDGADAEHPSDAPLAALWQITVKGLSQAQAALPQGFSTSPQTASVAGVLFNRGGVPTPQALEVVPPVAAIPAVVAGDLSDRPEPATPAVTSAPERAAEPATEIAPTATVPPAWTTVREGSQTTPPTAPMPGAFPDSTVYRPFPQAAPVTSPDRPAEAVPQPEPLAPAMSAEASTPNPVPGAIATLVEPGQAAVPEALPPAREPAVP
jgi:hypothetical protein